MKVTMHLTAEEIKEAILEYLEENRSDFIEPRNDSKGPAMVFYVNGKPVDGPLVVEVYQQMEVHDGHHPYR